VPNPFLLSRFSKELKVFRRIRCQEEPVLNHETCKISLALFFYNFSTFLGKPGIYLEDLYVKPEYRSNGFGRRMLAHIARLSKKRNCGRFEWSVLDWNEPAIRTYDRLNARPMKEWILYRLTGEALNKLAQEG